LIGRAFMSCRACSGFAAKVDTAYMTTSNAIVDRELECYSWPADFNDTPAAGWFHPSYLFGTHSPSTHLFTSSHHGVRHTLSSLPEAAFLSNISTQRAFRAAIRAVIQSNVLPARCSSSSCKADSTSPNSEKRRPKVAWGTEVRVVVRVFTRGIQYRVYSICQTVGRVIVTGTDLEIEERKIAESEEAVVKIHLPIAVAGPVIGVYICAD
jgi:hypothetical protein